MDAFNLNCLNKDFIKYHFSLNNHFKEYIH